MTEQPSRPLERGRHAGVLVPLASMPSTRSWGIGELGDLEPLAAWLRASGLDVVQLLPINEMVAGQASPYSAVSAMAIDPIYIRLPDVEDLSGTAGQAGAGGDVAERVAALRQGRRVDYSTVRALKRRELEVAFERFLAREWRPGTSRARALSDYIEQAAWWLDDHALFRAIHDDRSGVPWIEWPAELRDREPDALAGARRRLADAILFHQYCQWVAERQWQLARSRSPVWVLGDFPFMVALDSVDVWAHQAEFDLDATIGTPPDAFSETGQDWGLPAYRWEAVRARAFGWLRSRARRCAALFDGFRLDHAVGFYRTYARPRDGRPPRFEPALEADQRALGEQVISVCRAAGTFVVAEDLGTVPDFVRASLSALGVPGYRVLRWERRWHEPSRPFIDPAAYPTCSVATSGTHDTTTLAAWWAEAPAEERAQLLRLLGCDGPRADSRRPFDVRLRDAVLERLLGSASDLVILPIQDLFGWLDRINVPSTVSDRNWTFRLPWPVDALPEIPDASERAGALRAWSVRAGRVDGR